MKTRLYKFMGLFFLTALLFNSVSCSKKADNKPQFIEVYTGSCEPCKDSEDAYTILKKEFSSKVTFKRYNLKTPEGMMQVQLWGLKVVPTIIVLNKEGLEVFRHEGGFVKEDIAPVLKKLTTKE